jgi:uncharacterized protein
MTHMTTPATTLPLSVQKLTESVYARLGQVKLARMFEQAFPNTLTTTLRPQADGSVFVITGDIPAMWLRDSAAQLRPYLYLAAEDRAIGDLIAGVVKRQFQYIVLDPYANAFNETPNNAGHHHDLTPMSPWIWERKYEVDSLCYPLQLAYLLWKKTGRTAHFDDTFRQAVKRILETWQQEQDHSNSPYTFERPAEHLYLPTDTLQGGKGSPVGYTGMTWSGFRPSDDACTYHFLVPANMFAVVVLGYLTEIAQKVLRDADLATRASQLRDEIDEGIRTYGITQHPEFGRLYAYEVDGLGNYLLMDDANVPSLLAAPYLGYCQADDPLYQNTRRFLLSQHNPFYHVGKAAQGIGSPHTPGPYIWPIALCIQGLTSRSKEEQQALLELLSRTDANTNLMHESFHVDDPRNFSRPWFAWANSLFAEFVLEYLEA